MILHLLSNERIYNKCKITGGESFIYIYIYMQNYNVSLTILSNNNLFIKSPDYAHLFQNIALRLTICNKSTA